MRSNTGPDNAAIQSGVLLACLVIVSVLARQVFAKAFAPAGASGAPASCWR